MPTETAESKPRKSRTAKSVFNPNASLVSGQGSLLDHLELIVLPKPEGLSEDDTGYYMSSETAGFVLATVGSWLSENLTKGLTEDMMKQLGLRQERIAGGTRFVCDGGT